MQTERKREAGAATTTHGHEARAAPTAAPPQPPPGSPAEDRFLNVLVTPKITFSMSRKPQWRTPSDIPQDDLRQAFLARFPVRFDPAKLLFRPANPSLELKGKHDLRLVYRIGSDESDDERVLLTILRELDKAYSAKYESMLEEARSDLLSSSMTFQVVADEIRSGQQAAEKKWGGEVRQLKEQMSTNQKRLFLLEQEKEQLQKTVSSAEGETTQLRRSVASLAGENAALKQQQSLLEAQVAALRDLVSSRLEANAAGGGAERRVVPMVSTPTQTSSDSDEAARLEMAQWQQQLSKMSEWLRTGARLLEQPPNGLKQQITEHASGDVPYSRASVGAGHYSES